MSVVQSLYFVAIVNVILSHWIYQSDNPNLDLPVLDLLNPEIAFKHSRCAGALQMLSPMCFGPIGDLWMNIFYFGFGAKEGILGGEPGFGQQEVCLLVLLLTWQFWIPQVFGVADWLSSGTAGYESADSGRRLKINWFVLWLLVAKSV